MKAFTGFEMFIATIKHVHEIARSNVYFCGVNLIILTYL